MGNVLEACEFSSTYRVKVDSQVTSELPERNVYEATVEDVYVVNPGATAEKSFAMVPAITRGERVIVDAGETMCCVCGTSLDVGETYYTLLHKAWIPTPTPTGAPTANTANGTAASRRRVTVDQCTPFSKAASLSEDSNKKNSFTKSCTTTPYDQIGRESLEPPPLAVPVAEPVAEVEVRARTEEGAAAAQQQTAEDMATTATAAAAAAAAAAASEGNTAPVQLTGSSWSRTKGAGAVSSGSGFWWVAAGGVLVGVMLARRQLLH